MQGLWIGTYGGGVDLYDPHFGQFKFIDPKIKAEHDYGSIGPIIENKGKIWIGTEGGGLAYYDLNTRDYRFFDLTEPSNKSFNSNTIRGLCVDQNQKLWIGTYAGGIRTFNMETLKFEKRFDRSSGIDNNIVFDIYDDSADNIWVGSFSDIGLHFKSRNDDKFTPGYQSGEERFDFPWIRAIFESSPNEYWFGSMYYGLFIFKDGRTVKKITTANSGLSSDYISVIPKIPRTGYG